jgi:hypothetical protein
VTPQEEQLIDSLVERVNQTQLREKDPDAEDLLNKGLSGNPDALYILAQSVLIQNIALDQAKAQVAQLQQRLQQARQQPARATSFLGNLLGHHDPPQPAYTPVQQGYVPPPPPPPGYDPQYAQPQYVPAGPPSFLRGAMQTAAGVAAGALAFEGVESILHGMGGFGHPGFGMGGFGMGPGMMGGGGFERPVEETVVNNYYDQPGGQEHHVEQGGLGQGGQEQHFHETADQGGAQLSDSSYVQSGDDDQGNFDSGSFDDNSGGDNLAQDDGSGFDDGGGGGFDGGGGDFS